MKPKRLQVLLAAALPLFLAACSGEEAPVYDVVVLDGMIYDGSGGEPYAADIGIVGDRIVAIGELNDAAADRRLDATGKAVSPGFVNMLSWAPASLLRDGRSMSDIKQGVTLEVFGEGWSFGPLNDYTKENLARSFATPDGTPLDVEWTTLGEYFQHLEDSGVSPNFASFVGHTTVRMNVLGEDDVDPTPEQLAKMQAQVRQAMEDGAMGVGSSLIYAPANYAETDELIALVDVAAEYGGGYISHMRSEGDRLLEAVEELITIARETGAFAEIYHLKAAGQDNWDKMDDVIAMVEAAHAEGLRITADVYTYPAGATGLDAAMPTWVQAGGLEAWIERLKDPETRAMVAEAIAAPGDDWENLYYGAGPEGLLFAGFRNPELRKYIGMTLAEVAEERGTSPEQTIIDLVIEDESRVDTIYFLMSEENMRFKIAQPWVAIDSDAPSIAVDGPAAELGVHPRTYGTFARLLAKYVREENVISLAEGVRRMTSLPTGTLGIRDRGLLEEGYYADIVVFDPDTIQDHATFEDPHQYATGVDHVLVNGEVVLFNGEHTGAMPGRAIRGPGWRGWENVPSN